MKNTFIALILLFTSGAQGASLISDHCSELFLTHAISQKTELRSSQKRIHRAELTAHVAAKIEQVLEFKYIRELAQKMGLRVWLFGGTASSFLHYAKWDLASSQGLVDLQRDRLNYDFINIFRSTQDIDLVVDATPEEARKFETIVSNRFPHFHGDRGKSWEVRTLRFQMGTPGQSDFKEALLDDSDFRFQNTDSHSLGMIEISIPRQEPLIRDLKSWHKKRSIFLEDALNQRITYFRSKSHFSTVRAKADQNPEILSVLRVLVKSFQFGLSFSQHDWMQIREISSQFNPNQIQNQIAKKKIGDTAKKLVIHAENIEKAINTLDQLDLRAKLISMGNKKLKGDFAWWLNREPLRSKPIGDSTRGHTAKEMGIEVVAHEANSYLSSESIVRSHSGEPNVFISRVDAVGESAAFGNGFYTAKGRASTAGTGMTIRFNVAPQAREGSDFIFISDQIIIFKNKNALKLIPESLSLQFGDVIKLASSVEENLLDHSDLRLLEIQKRSWNNAKILNELEKIIHSDQAVDFDRLFEIIQAIFHLNHYEIFTHQVKMGVASHIFDQIKSKAQSDNDFEKLKYIKIIGQMLHVLDSIDSLDIARFQHYLFDIIKEKKHGFLLRKEAIFEFYLANPKQIPDLRLRDWFSDQELNRFIPEIASWWRSTDTRKSSFFMDLSQRWSQAIEQARITDTILPLIDSGLFSLNGKNYAQKSILQIASYNEQYAILDWLIKIPGFDFNNRDELGYTEVEQLILSGKLDWADEIRKKRPEIQVRTFEIRERDITQNTKNYPQGIPFVDFVKFEPGVSIMSRSKQMAFIQITKPFEILSIDTTPNIYFGIAKLLQKYLVSEYPQPLNNHGSDSIDDFTLLNSISFDDVNHWIQGVNQLSILDNLDAQRELELYLPGHRKGAQYDLPTEAQWEYVARLGGLADGQYSHSSKDNKLSEYYVFAINRYSRDPFPPLVGSKRPVFYNGKPLYDLCGMASRWTRDWHSARLRGGVDPQGPTQGTYKTIRGSSYFSENPVISTSTQFSPNTELSYVGFRLVRLKNGN